MKLRTARKVRKHWLRMHDTIVAWGQAAWDRRPDAPTDRPPRPFPEKYRGPHYERKTLMRAMRRLDPAERTKWMLQLVETQGILDVQKQVEDDPVGSATNLHEAFARAAAVLALEPKEEP